MHDVGGDLGKGECIRTPQLWVVLAAVRPGSNEHQHLSITGGSGWGLGRERWAVLQGGQQKSSGGRKKNNNNIGSLPTEERQGLTYSSVARQKVASAKVGGGFRGIKGADEDNLNIFYLFICIARSNARAFY